MESTNAEVSNDTTQEQQDVTGTHLEEEKRDITKVSSALKEPTEDPE